MEGRHDDENLYVSKYRNGGSGGGSAAADISYDDSQTHLNAANVQQAIEALDTRCDANSQNIETLSANKQDKLSAGEGIQILNNEISVKTVYDSTNETLTIGL